MKNLLEKGITYFNSGYFFEGHDAFEEIWMDDREESKLFYQGLVQLSTGFYHLVMQNLKGAESQLSKGLQKLIKYKPIYQNIDVTKLSGQVESCINIIRDAELAEGFYTELITSIPKLKQGVIKFGEDKI